MEDTDKQMFNCCTVIHITYQHFCFYGEVKGDHKTEHETQNVKHDIFSIYPILYHKKPCFEDQIVERSWTLWYASDLVSVSHNCISNPELKPSELKIRLSQNHQTLELK